MLGPRTAVNTGLLVLSVCLGFLLTELGFRLLVSGQPSYPVVFYGTEDPDVTLLCYDDRLQSPPDYDLRTEHPYRRLAYVGNMDLDERLENLPVRVVPLAIEWRRNPQGFRERSFDELPPATRVTLVVGDSFCFGQGVRVQDRFSDVLERRLAESSLEWADGRRVIVNLCELGLDIQGALDVLRSVAERDWTVERIVYAYTLNDPVEPPELRYQQLYINDLMHFRARNLDTALAADAPWYAWSRLLSTLHRNWIASEVTQRTESWYRALHDNEEGWPKTQKVLRRMARVAERQDAELVLVVFPLFHRFDHYPFGDIHERLRALAEQQGVAFVDLLPTFEDLDERALQVHPVTDFHPNHLAHRRAAEALLEALAW